MTLPASPEEFFGRYVPERFAAEKAHFSGISSHGSLVFWIGELSAWSLKLENGELLVRQEAADDPALQVAFLNETDFSALIAHGLQDDATSALEQRVLALKALSAPKDQIELVSQLDGTVELAVTDGPRAFLSAGKTRPNTEAPDCRMELSSQDFVDVQLGRQSPVQLFMNGRIRIAGDAQLPLAFASLLA